MCDKEFKELVKIAIEKLKDKSVLKLLQADWYSLTNITGRPGNAAQAACQSRDGSVVEIACKELIVM